MIPVHLRGMTWDHPRGPDCLAVVSEVYKARSGVAVRSLQAFADAPVRELAGMYDLIILDHPHVGLITENKCLVPLGHLHDVCGNSKDYDVVFEAGGSL